MRIIENIHMYIHKNPHKNVSKVILSLPSALTNITLFLLSEQYVHDLPRKLISINILKGKKWGGVIKLTEIAITQKVVNVICLFLNEIDLRCRYLLGSTLLLETFPKSIKWISLVTMSKCEQVYSAL